MGSESTRAFQMLLDGKISQWAMAGPPELTTPEVANMETAVSLSSSVQGHSQTGPSVSTAVGETAVPPARQEERMTETIGKNKVAYFAIIESCL
jgi:hypothetical protein